MIASDAISNGCRVTLKRMTRDIDNRIAVERLTNRRGSVQKMSSSFRSRIVDEIRCDKLESQFSSSKKKNQQK